MIKRDKIASLATAMTQSKRVAGEQFYHFTPEAPQELVNIFLSHYTVNDLDYEIFSNACDIVSEINAEGSDESTGRLMTDEYITEQIYERAAESASYYTYDRLQYLNNNTEGEISDIMREYQEETISNACALWYDRQVEQAAIIIKDWVNA